MPSSVLRAMDNCWNKTDEFSVFTGSSADFMGKFDNPVLVCASCFYGNWTKISSVCLFFICDDILLATVPNVLVSYVVSTFATHWTTMSSAELSLACTVTFQLTA